jgi:hypothetical protein
VLFTNILQGADVEEEDRYCNNLRFATEDRMHRLGESALE